jgi:hypothetical protein
VDLNERPEVTLDAHVRIGCDPRCTNFVVNWPKRSFPMWGTASTATSADHSHSGAE